MNIFNVVVRANKISIKIILIIYDNLIKNFVEFCFKFLTTNFLSNFRIKNIIIMASCHNTVKVFCPIKVVDAEREPGNPYANFSSLLKLFIKQSVKFAVKISRGNYHPVLFIYMILNVVLRMPSLLYEILSVSLLLA